MGKLEFGGSLNLGKRKSTRPFDSKRPIHIVLRSTKAVGKFSLYHQKFKSHVNALTFDLASKHNLRIYNFVNSGNHLHLLLKSKNKSDLQKFFRELTSKIALMVYKGLGKFWTSIVYTKLISWGRQFENVYNYILQNELETWGAIPHQPRGQGCLEKKSFLILEKNFQATQGWRLKGFS